MSTTEPRKIERRRGASRFFTPRRVARTAILVALSAVGAFIKLPSPTGTVALDSAPAFLAGAAFSPAEGSIVGALGHLLSALTTGFPLGLPVHLLVAAEMALFVAVFAFLARRVNIWLAVVIGILLNGIGGAAIMIPIGGVGLFAALVLPLTVGSAINILVGTAAMRALRSAGLTEERTA
ncbi:MAG TPA: ECF transporter S component [Micromonosporaceae bacterium]|nr:ECF transporter S component [Micromonosporaceae bacterium]